MGRTPLIPVAALLAVPVVGLLVLIVGAGGRRPLGAPSLALLADAVGGGAEQRARLRDRRCCPPAGRRAGVPRLARLPRRGRVPRAARARDAGRAARREQRRLRDLDADRARRRRWRSPRPPPSTSGTSAATASAARSGGCRGAARRMGVWAVHLAHGAGARRRRARAGLRRARSCSPLLAVALFCLRRRALRAALAGAPRTAPARVRRRLHAARRGRRRDRARAQLARLVVGVARADAGRLRPDRAQRAPRVARGALQRPLPAPAPPSRPGR